MNISDEAKLFAVRARLLEAERKIYEANKIIANINASSISNNTNLSSTALPTEHMRQTVDGEPLVNGLYPGQLGYAPGESPEEIAATQKIQEVEEAGSCAT